MQVLDSLIDGPLELSNTREGNELIGMIVRYLRTGSEPEPRTDAQKMALAMVAPVLEKSRRRIEAGSEGGSKQASKSTSKTPSKQVSKTVSKQASKSTSKQVSDIYSSSFTPLPNSKEEGSGEEEIPYSEIVDYLNSLVGSAYKTTSRKTKELIHARWAEGFRLDDFKAVVDRMHSEWASDAKMCGYLRPETLFGSKFESYLNRPKPARREDGHAERDIYSSL